MRVVARFFPSRMPNSAAISPKPLLAMIFRIAILYSPERRRTIVSRVNEEKVVNPPKNPVKRNALIGVEK